MYENIKFEVSSEGIATITFIREKALNAINTKTAKELEEVINKIEDDPNIRVLVFKGSGRAFIAGADIKEFKGRTIPETKKFSQYLQKVFNKIEMLPIP
ncbi:MAG: enoyl-CoA hydratase/isomerase family protein, partial [Candidatus Hodarchaeota archaeon]